MCGLGRGDGHGVFPSPSWGRGVLVDTCSMTRLDAPCSRGMPSSFRPMVDEARSHRWASSEYSTSQPKQRAWHGVSSDRATSWLGADFHGGPSHRGTAAPGTIAWADERSWCRGRHPVGPCAAFSGHRQRRGWAGEAGRAEGCVRCPVWLGSDREQG